MSFEHSWPELSRKLGHFLSARRVPACQRDDIMQEIAIRLFRTWHRIDPDQGAWGLARMIAIHAISDRAHDEHLHEALESIDIADSTDLERAGIARFRLASVGRALPQLSSTDQQILLAEVGAASPPKQLGRSAAKMARLRARRRLRGLVHKPGSWGTFPSLLLRPRAAALRRLMERPAMYSPFAEGTIAVLVGMTLSVATLDFPGPPKADAPRSEFSIGSARGDVPIDPRPGDAVARRGSDSRWSLHPDGTRAGSGPNNAQEGSGSGGVEDDPLYVRDTAEGAREDANGVRGEAEQLTQDAQQEAEDSQEAAEEESEHAEETAEEEAGYAHELAEEEVEEGQQTAEEHRP